jgi:dolichol-phosphate mannosyltransferase
MSVADASEKVEISVLVPVMNEAGNIRPLMNEIAAVFAGRSFEILYINDGSTDNTAKELAEAGAAIPQLRILNHENRSGQSAALRSGLFASRGDIIAVLDGDGQNIPADFAQIEKALIGARPALGMAGGVRTRRQDSWIKLRASHCAKWIRASLLGDSHPDSGCGIKMVDRDIFLKLPYFNHMHRFMPVLVRREGGVVLPVAVGHRARERGISKYGVIDRLVVGITDILGVIWLMKRSAHPGHVSETGVTSRADMTKNNED